MVADLVGDFRDEVVCFGKTEEGNPLLATEAARDIVADALRSLHKEKYLLHAYVVMPNHFHAILLPLPKPARTMNLGGSAFPARHDGLERPSYPFCGGNLGKYEKIPCNTEGR
ncbi:MAG: hypothetical protein O6850_02315, partial [Acidobacteria bacterium]|nr:hypothetical protein [Acidobacteriota bacterium]